VPLFDHEDTEEEPQCVDPALDPCPPGLLPNVQRESDGFYWQRVSTEGDDGDEVKVRIDPLVGRRVSVYWDDDETWYDGVVGESDDVNRGSHLILYDIDLDRARESKKRAQPVYSWLDGPKPRDWDDDHAAAQPEPYRFI